MVKETANDSSLNWIPDVGEIEGELRMQCSNVLDRVHLELPSNCTIGVLTALSKECSNQKRKSEEELIKAIILSEAIDIAMDNLKEKREGEEKTDT